jgi:hypothetical protein
MLRSEHNWTRTFVRRGLVAALMVLALALYGLVTAGTQSLAFKPAASTLPGDGGRSVSQAVSPTNNSLNVATQGPSHTLYFFWNVAGTWYGPLGIGAPGSTWSAPAIVSEGNGNFDIAVQGPSNTLDFYWDISGTWYGPFQVAGAGTTFSTPGLAVDNAQHLQIAAEGPSNTLDLYWNVNAQFYGPLGIGGPNSTFSGPAVGFGSSFSSEFYIWVQAANHSVEQYLRTGGVWSSPRDVSNDNTTYSAITLFNNTFRATFEGPNHSLYDAEGGDSSHVTVQVRGAGTTYSTPSEVGTGSRGPGNRFIAVEGPSNTLYFYFHNITTGNLDGPLQIGAPGSTFASPNIVKDNNNNEDIAVQGPGNALWAYFDIAGVIHGPLQIGRPGTSFSSAN